MCNTQTKARQQAEGCPAAQAVCVISRLIFGPVLSEVNRDCAHLYSARGRSLLTVVEFAAVVKIIS